MKFMLISGRITAPLHDIHKGLWLSFNRYSVFICGHRGERPLFIDKPNFKNSKNVFITWAPMRYGR